MASIKLVFVKTSASFDDGTKSVLFKATTKQGGVHNVWHTVDASYKEGSDYILDTSVEGIQSKLCADGKTRAIVVLR